MKPPDSFTFHRPADLPESCNSSPGALRTQLSGVQRKDSAIDPKKRPARGWSKKPSRVEKRLQVWEKRSDHDNRFCFFCVRASRCVARASGMAGVIVVRLDGPWTLHMLGRGCQ
jgi:hypothetical protein